MSGLIGGNVLDIQEMRLSIDAMQQKISASLRTIKTIEQMHPGVQKIDISKISPRDLFALLAPISAQKKALIIERYIINCLGLTHVPAAKNQGDACGIDIVDDNNDATVYYELKTSTLNDARALNARQIRLWQNVDYYLVSYIDELDYDASYCYLLTHDEMKAEVALYGSASHGTTAANNRNENIEYSLTVTPNSDIKARWDKRYKSAKIEQILDIR